MKTTLTSSDPEGWYLCKGHYDSLTKPLWWNGERLHEHDWCNGEGWPELPLSRYKSFQLMTTESDVAALNDELRTLRERNDELFAANQVLQFQVSTLTSDLEKVKDQPYEMRRADKPDCIGLWMSVDGDVYSIPLEVQLQNYTWRGPYHYLGPIPVVVEQLPPKVVRVRHNGTGVECDAVLSINGTFIVPLSKDGLASDTSPAIYWEVIQ